MSYLGAALILLGSLAAAGRFIEEQRRRLCALRDMCAALERLRAELSLRAAGLPELTKLLAESSDNAAGRFFSALREALPQLGEHSFSELWTGCVSMTLPELSDVERTALRRLGETLGRYELSEQLGALERCRAALMESVESLSEALPEKRRLTFGLLGAAGALLCICLL